MLFSQGERYDDLLAAIDIIPFSSTAHLFSRTRFCGDLDQYQWFSQLSAWISSA